MVQVVRGALGQQRLVPRAGGLPTSAIQMALELALCMLDRPIVGRHAARADDRDRDHQSLLQDLVDREVVQVTAVVALAEQRRVEPAEQVLQVTGHFLPAGQILRGQRGKGSVKILSLFCFSSAPL